MPPPWLQIRVELLGGQGAELDPPPGRVFALPPSTTFERLADAINAAFGRWDLSHLHEFALSGGRRVGFTDPEFEMGDVIDHSAKVGSLVLPGDDFAFVFDLGDQWEHRCQVLEGELDPGEEFGELPREPVILWGWGWLPDQYGRERDEDG